MSLKEITIPIEKAHEIDEHVRNLESENKFLKQRNRALRQKSWINVYDENLKMIDEIKALKHENEVKFNDLVKYEKTIEQLRKELMQMGKIADSFRRDSMELKEEKKKLNGVINSVQTFLDQFTK